MKEFLKNHPEFLITPIAVIVIDIVVIFMWSSELNATTETQADVKEMSKDSVDISKSNYKLDSNNSEAFQAESKRWVAGYRSYLAIRQKAYHARYIYDPETTKKTRAKTNFKSKVGDLINKLADVHTTDNKMSFSEFYAMRWSDLSSRKIGDLFAVLEGVEQISKLALEAGIKEISEVDRVNGIEFVKDKTNSTASFTYSFNMTTGAEGLKKMLNY